MARPSRTILLVLLISLPILATVITAFRIRDPPKDPSREVRQKHEKCDQCDSETNIKTESARRSYEEMKKAVLEKQQALKKQKLVKLVHSNQEDDDDDDDDEDLEHIELKSKSSLKHGSDSKEVKGTFELKIEKSSKIPIINDNYNDDDDDDDDDDDNDDEKDSASSKELKDKRSTSKQTTSKNILHKKSDDSEVHYDDNDDDDDVNDNIETKSKSNVDKINKHLQSEDQNKPKDDFKLKVQSLSHDDNDDDDDDEDDDDNGDDDDENDYDKKEAKKRVSEAKKKVDIINKGFQAKLKETPEHDEKLKKKVTIDSVDKHPAVKNPSITTPSKPAIKEVVKDKTLPSHVTPKNTESKNVEKLAGKTKPPKKDQLATKKVENLVKKDDQIKDDDDDDDDGDDDDDDDEKNYNKPKETTHPIKKPTTEIKVETKKSDKTHIQEDHNKKKAPENIEKNDKSKKVQENKEPTTKKPESKPKLEPVKLQESDHKLKVEVQYKEPVKEVKPKQIPKKEEEKSSKEPQKPKVEEKKHEPKSLEENKKTDSKEKKRHEKEHFQKDLSRETLVDFEEMIAKSDSHMKPLSEALKRRNLIQSEFEDFYSFFPTFAPNFSRIHNPECRRHGQILLRQLRGTKLWALNMLDATAKIPSGILQGNGIQLGDFDQCIGSRARVQLDTGSVVKVQGQYCLVLVDVKAEHPELEVPVHLAQARSVIKSRIDDPGHFVPRFSTLSWGVCVPAACEPQDVETIVRDAIKHYQHTSGLVVRIKVDPDDCHAPDGNHWWEDWMELPTLLTLSLYGVVVLLVLLATVQDYFARRKPEEGTQEDDDKAECDQKDLETQEDVKEEKPVEKSEGEGFLSAFSMYKNVNQLLQPGSADEISCIHGVRGIATLALLVAHKFLAVAVAPFTNRLKMTEDFSSAWWSWSRAGWMYTDCFLLLSGTLLAHRISANSNNSAARRLLSRYIRLTPALVAVVLFYAYIWERLGSGPRWGTYVTKNAQLCQQGWWWNLMYVQNYFGFEDMCAAQTHQLALDMQLTILGSFLVWIIQTKPGASKFLLPVIHVAAAYSRYTTVQEHRLTLLAYHGASVSQLHRTARLSYTSTFHRCSPYLLGITLGLMLQKPAKHNKLVQILGWLASATLWCLVWWAGLDSGAANYRYNAFEAAQYAALAPIAASLATCWLIYAVHNGCSETLAKFLVWPPLVFISRLSYSLYLIQFIVFFSYAATARTSSEFSLISLIDVQEMCTILLAAVVLNITFVTPIQSLQKYFTNISFSKSEPSEEPEASESLETEVDDKEKESSQKEEEEEEQIQEREVLQTRTRQTFLAHREVLEEIPEAEVEYELQRDRDDGLEEILEEEEEEGEGIVEEEEDPEVIEEEDLQDDELEVIEEEGGEDDFWADRETDHVPRRSVPASVEDEAELEEWEWTNGNRSNNGGQYYRYNR